jgi:hypothetical protein
MHGTTNPKFINAKQASDIYAYKNITINITINWCIWLGVLFEYLKMHGTTNPKFINAKQARDIYAYKNITINVTIDWCIWLGVLLDHGTEPPLAC